MLSFSHIFILILMSPQLCNIRATSAPYYTVNPKNISHVLEDRIYTWHDFKKFEDASKGSHINGISRLKRYFNKFGYLETDDVMNSTDIFDSNLELAIAKYQQRFGLPVTKKLNPSTLREIMSPRCGARDISSTALKATENYAYFTGRSRWGRDIPMVLTYAFSPGNTISSLRNDDVKGVFKRAFGHWARVVPITFIESDDYGFSDIKIGFYSGDHGDGDAFDGILGVLGHAFYPEIGRLHLDAAETWAIDFAAEKAANAVDLESVATHEIGHLLGLAHSSDREAAMYPSLKPRERKASLNVDDIRCVQALYGSNPNFSLQAFSESDVFSNSGGVDRRVGEDGIFVRVHYWMLVLVLWLCM